MMVKFFRQGGRHQNKSSNSVKNYLLDVDRVDAQHSRVLRGDVDFVSSQIDLCNKLNFSSTYTSGCLSFDESENLTEEQKQELMQSFEEALLPDFDPARYASYWVEHTDKQRLELNFVFAKIDLATAKHLDVFQHERDVKRLNAWKEIKCNEYDLADPNDPARKRVLKLFSVKRADGTTSDDKHATTKKEINDYILTAIEHNLIHNSSDVKRFIEFALGDESDPTGYQVKQNKTGISITDTTTNEKFRIQGQIYAKDFVITPNHTSESSFESRLENDRVSKKIAYDRQKNERLRSANQHYQEYCNRRSEELKRKYDSSRELHKLVAESRTELEVKREANSSYSTFSISRDFARSSQDSTDESRDVDNRISRDNSKRSQRYSSSEDKTDREDTARIEKADRRDVESVEAGNVFTTSNSSNSRSFNVVHDDHVFNRDEIQRNKHNIYSTDDSFSDDFVVDVDNTSESERNFQNLAELDNEQKSTDFKFRILREIKRKIEEFVAKIANRTQSREERTRIAREFETTKHRFTSSVRTADSIELDIEATEQELNRATRYSEFISRAFSSDSRALQDSEDYFRASTRKFSESRAWLQSNDYRLEEAQRAFNATEQENERAREENDRTFEILIKRDRAVREYIMNAELSYKSSGERLTQKAKEDYLNEKCVLELTPAYTELQKELKMKKSYDMTM